MRDGAHLEAVRQHAAMNARESGTAPLGPGVGSADRSTGSRDVHLDRIREAPAAARRAARRSAPRAARPTSQRSTRGGDRLRRRRVVARAVGGEVARDRRERRCRRSADRTCRRSRRSSAGDRRTALGLRARALELLCASVRSRRQLVERRRAMTRIEIAERDAGRGRRRDLEDAGDLARVLIGDDIGRRSAVRRPAA